MPHADSQHALQMASANDQDPVEAVRATTTSRGHTGHSTYKRRTRRRCPRREATRYPRRCADATSSADSSTNTRQPQREIEFNAPHELAALRFRSDEFKELEIVVLRHELAVLRRQLARPELNRSDRVFLAAASRVLPRASWRSFVVTPTTLLRWHLRLVAKRISEAVVVGDRRPFLVALLVLDQAEVEKGAATGQELYPLVEEKEKWAMPMAPVGRGFCR